jgi:hypothetical protein
MDIDKTLTGGKRLPYCKYPGASDTEQHGLQPLPDVLPIIDLETARQYRNSKFQIVKADSLGVERLLQMIRVIALSFAANDPTIRHLNLPKDCPIDRSAFRHKDPLGDDYFGDWTKENLVFWLIRLFFVTDPFSPLGAIENNFDTIRQSLAALNDKGEVIGAVLNIKLDLSNTGRVMRDNDPFISAIVPFFEPISQLVTTQVNLSLNAVCKKYPVFLTALKEGKVADLNMVARSPLLPSEDTFELVAASAEHLQQLGFQLLVVSAGNQWTGAAIEIMNGVKVHFAAFRDSKRAYENNEPVVGKPSSKDGYISDKDSGSMFYVIRLIG